MEVESYHVFSAIPISCQRLLIVMLSHIPSLHHTHILLPTSFIVSSHFMFSFVTLVSLGSYLSSLSSLFCLSSLFYLLTFLLLPLHYSSTGVLDVPSLCLSYDGFSFVVYASKK